MSRPVQFAVTTLVLAGILVAVGISRLNAFLDTPLSMPAEQSVIDVKPGTSFAAVTQELSERGFLEHPHWLRWYGRLTGKASRIKAGEYRIKAGTSPRELLEELIGGQVYLHSLTIIEGWRFTDLLEALKQSDALTQTIGDAKWELIADKIGATEPHPEGLFLPETYRFPKGTSDVELLARAYRHLQEVLDQEWQKRTVTDVFKEPYEALILASIIEKETARTDERERISGVFVRRLQKGMRLQTDPTVIYGLGEAFDGNLRRRDLRADTPYNTYRRSGLPPTPIALAGRAAIRAALNPANGTELYFVATGLGDGSHRFSETREEHERAVQEYLQRLRSRKSGN